MQTNKQTKMVQRCFTFFAVSQNLNKKKTKKTKKKGFLKEKTEPFNMDVTQQETKQLH